MRRALLLPLLLLAPLAHAGPGVAPVVIEEGDDLATPAGWRGAPLVLGTDCGRTDLRRATLAPAEEGGVAVSLQVRDVTEACMGENPPHQSFGYTLNLLLRDGGEAWTEVSLRRGADGSLDADGRWAVRCSGRVPLPTTRCDVMPTGALDAALDVQTSTLSFRAPFAWDEVAAAWLASVMWECSSSGGGTVCVTGSLVGPGDRMPDVGERRIR